MDEQNVRPLVSIIVPVFNGEKYIQECLCSLTAQTYKPTEIIIVDDGSTDGSTAIAKSLKLNNLKVVAGEHNNLPSARNKGIIHSRGDFIGFCDVDDIWLPEKLQLQINILLNEPEIDMCFSNVICFSLNGERFFGKNKLKRCRAINKNKINQLELLLHQNLIVPSTVVVRKKIFDSIGLFDETLHTCEDWEFVLRAAALNMSIKYLDTITVRYRLHDSNMSSNALAMHKGRMDVLTKIFQMKPTIDSKTKNKALAIAYIVSANAFYKQTDFEKFGDCVKKVWHFDKTQLTSKVIRRWMRVFLTKKVLSK